MNGKCDNRKTCTARSSHDCAAFDLAEMALVSGSSDNVEDSIDGILHIVTDNGESAQKRGRTFCSAAAGMPVTLQVRQ